MTELLDEIAGYLVANVPGLTAGVNLFGAGFEDEASIADPQVSLYEPGGSQPWLTMGSGLPEVEQPRLQVMVRSADYAAGRLLAKKIWRALAVVTEQQIGGVRYLRLSPVDSPGDVGRDEQARYLTASNFEVSKELSPL